MDGLFDDPRSIDRPRQARRQTKEGRGTQDLYRVLFESNPMPMWVYELETLRFVDVNAAAIRTYGYSRDEFLSMTIADIRPEEDVSRLLANVRAARRAPAAIGIWRHRKKDGTVIDVEVVAHDLPIGRGRYRLVLAHDVTERTREERHRSLEFSVTRVLSQYRTLQETLPKLLEAICKSMGWELGEAWLPRGDPDRLAWAGAWHPSDAALSRFAGRSRNVTFARHEGLAGRVWARGRPEWAVDLRQHSFTRRALATEAGLRSALVFPIPSRHGASGVLAFFSRVSQDPDEKTLDLVEALGSRIGMFVDREQAQEAEHRFAERFRTVFASSPVPIVLSRISDGRIYDANDAFLKFLGYTREEALGRTSTELGMIDPAARERVLRLLQEQGSLTSEEVVARTKDGEARRVLISSEIIRIDHETSLLTTIVDITDRTRAEEERTRADRKFRTLFEAAADAIVVIDRMGNIADVNPSVEALLGRPRSELVGRNMAEILPADQLPAARDYLRNVLRDRPVQEPFEIGVDTPGGRRILEVRSRVLRAPGDQPSVQIVSRDVTEQREMNRRLVESERLASVGQVAAYVAHEINTPLTNIALLSGRGRRLVHDSKVREKFEKIDDQRRIAGHIIHELLTITQAREINRLDTDVREVVGIALDLVESHRRKGVAIVKEFGEEPIRARVDPLRLQQAVANLVKNALQATSRGAVTVRLEPTPQDVTIVVRDTGTGMTHEVLERLFQAFFTTKAAGEGTGLGLAFTRSVVQAHGGTIDVDSKEGEGATFTIRIPRDGEGRGTG